MSIKIGDVILASIGGIMAFVAVIWAIPFIAAMGLWSSGTSTALISTGAAYEDALPLIGILLGVLVFAGVLSR